MKFNSRTLNQEFSSIIHCQRFKDSSSLPRFIKALKGYSAWVNKVILGEFCFCLFSFISSTLHYGLYFLILYILFFTEILL